MKTAHTVARKLRNTLLFLLLPVSAWVLAGCGGSSGPGTSASDDNEAPTAEERVFLEAGRPFVEALAARDYAAAYQHLSSHARARVTLNQFVAPTDDATQQRNEAGAIQNMTPEQFVQGLGATAENYGEPARLLDLDVFSTDATVLSGQAKTLEDRMEAMFAIGLMPASVPAQIRKASLRAKLLVKLSPQQLAEAAKAEQTTPEKLLQDPEFQPYVNLKAVLVEEAGALKVGYFEIVPPGIWD